MLAVLVRDYIPRQLHAEQEAALRDACTNPAVNLPKGLMTYLLDKVGLSSSGKHRNAARDARMCRHVECVLEASDNAFIKNALAAGYNPMDMRFLNGRHADTAFNDFIDVVHNLLTERDQLAAEERRRADATATGPSGEVAPVRPTALAPSMRALRDMVIQAMHANPEINARLLDGSSKIPALPTFETFMSPSHPDRLVSDRLSGRAGIVFKVQSRTARKAHVDAHYNNMQALLLRAWVGNIAAQGYDICFISDDDKCKIPVGAPGLPQTALVRQRRVIAGENEVVQALDHDFNCDSITPSVKLVVVPTESTSNEAKAYYNGRVYVSLKDAVLQASTPLRHAAETLQTLRLAELCHSSVLVIRTDGGPDRNNTFVAVQLAFLALALELDLDCLILMRTTPGQSYVNPVERVMSVLNLAMYGMSLARGHTGDETSELLKNCNTMKQRREALGASDACARAFAESMQVCCPLLTSGCNIKPFLTLSFYCLKKWLLLLLPLQVPAKFDS
jgi:hypothetical protein